jgi:hypothetical protein
MVKSAKDAYDVKYQIPHELAKDEYEVLYTLKSAKEEYEV